MSAGLFDVLAIQGVWFPVGESVPTSFRDLGVRAVEIDDIVHSRSITL